MTQKQEPRKHHYIPEYYLKPWGRQSDRRIAQFGRVGPTNRIFRKWVYPGETGYKFNLYKLPNVDIGSQNWLESEFLGLVDADGARARDLLLAGEQLPGRLRSAWSRAIISFIHRNPEKIADINRVWTEGYAEITERLQPKYLALRKKTDPETWDEYVASQKKGTSEILFANLVKRMMDNEQVGNALNRMTWRVLDLSSATRSLMTSDRPVVIPHGLANNDSVVHIALSPKHLFIACTDVARLDYILSQYSNDFIVGSHNDAVSKQAQDYVWAIDHAKETYVDKRLGRFPIQSFGWRPGQRTSVEIWDKALANTVGPLRLIRDKSATRVEKKIRGKKGHSQQR